MKIRRCSGEGQGSCWRCEEKGIWNRKWMIFLYKIEDMGLQGCYCRCCVDEIAAIFGEDVEVVGA